MKQEIYTLSDKDMVLFALYILGGWRKRVHTEDIALKCYQLAPSKFSWIKYPQYPDLQPVRFALEKCGALVSGGSERKEKSIVAGWRLTENGIQWLEANRSRIERCLGTNLAPKARLSEDRRLRELLRSAGFERFRNYGEKAEISHADFAESFVCTVNTKPEVLNERLEQVYSAAEVLKQEKVKDYINFCQRRFASLLGRKGEENNAKG